MKIKALIIAMLAMVSAVSFTSCSDDDDDVTNNYTKYQKAVDSQVKAQKNKTGNKRAILLVAFGSTWQCAFDSFDATKAAYESEFKGYDVYVSYSSAICINRAAAGEHAAEGAQVRNYYAPNFWLHALGDAKYEEIVVQSLQVIPGEEFTRVVNYIKDFGNNSLGDLDDKYLQELIEDGHLKLGTPLLTSLDDDIPAVAAALDGYFAKEAAQGVVAFMGHGNPDEYDTYSANVRYSQLEEALKAKNPNYYIGTVDAPESYKTFVWYNMAESGITNGKVYLHPLMSIAGDHAHNDMGGDDDALMDPSEFAAYKKSHGDYIELTDGSGYALNEDGEIEDTSWKMFFRNLGYDSKDEYCSMKGLLDLENVRKIWMNHTRNAVNSEGLTEYFHSMFPEE